MMRKLPRNERIAVTIWVIVSLVVWNGVYDLLMTRGIKDYLLRQALHQTGRGPEVSMTALIDFAITEATWVSTLWASVILLAGLMTIRLLTSRVSSG
jgi:uncharacterized membrane protein SpoIIM required for sporulation